jgi:hypothetical protein
MNLFDTALMFARHNSLRAARSVAKIGFKYELEIWRNGVLIDQDIAHNIIPYEGLNHILSVVVAAGTQVTTWYTGLFEGNYTPVLSDTMAAFVAAATECTAYSEGARQAYVEGTPASGVITNVLNKAQFTMNAAKTLYGGFLASNSASGSTSGVLLSAAKFSTSKSVDIGDLARITASLTLTSS